MTVPTLRYRIVPNGTLLRSRILPSVPALEISLRVSGGFIQWRRGESGAYENLIATAALAPSAAEILALLLTVDGAGSLLDADLLDGQSSAYYLARANHTGTQLLATISDVTASPAELNILDGATLSTAELNHVDGVTSPIQTQLDAKQPIDASLTAYAALVTAADKAIYFTAADTPVTYDITAYGRTLAGLADETALEALIDTLPNLISIQGRTVTLADAEADAFLGWDDSASAYQNLSAADARTALGMTANAQSLVTAANYAAMRALLDLEAGTDFYSIAAANAAFQPIDADLTSWAGVTRAAGFDTFAATPSSANLASLVTDETGTGALVLATSPTLVTPALGTPSALVLTNATGLTTAGVAAATLVTAAETIAANNNDTTIPTSAAVKAYADSVAGAGFTAATQAEQETASSTTVGVTPGRQHFHPSAVKAWVDFTTVTTTSINSSYNITSLTDNGTGDTTITIGVDFSSANYCAVAGLVSTEQVVGHLFQDSAFKAAGTLRVYGRNSTNAASDFSECNVAMMGDQ